MGNLPEIVLRVLLLFLVLYLLALFQTKFEHLIRTPPLTEAELRERWTLHFFKISRISLFAIGALEATILSQWTRLYFVLGISLMLIGMTLRVIAIKSLGPMWSFQVVKYRDHIYVQP